MIFTFYCEWNFQNLNLNTISPFLLTSELLKEAILDTSIIELTFVFRCCEKSMFLNIAKFVGKHLCWRPATLFEKRIQRRCFPINFTKFLIEHIPWVAPVWRCILLETSNTSNTDSQLSKMHHIHVLFLKVFVIFKPTSMNLRWTLQVLFVLEPIVSCS